MQNSQRGSVKAWILIIIVLIIGAGVYAYARNNKSPETRSALVDLGAGYSKDAQHVYFTSSGRSASKIIPDADPMTFSVFDADDLLAKDASSVYSFGEKLVGADFSTFKNLGNNFFKDASHVWLRGGLGKLIPVSGADAATFSVATDQVTNQGGYLIIARDVHNTYSFGARAGELQSFPVTK